MAAFPQTITSQNPVDLGGGFEDPMDPCTMCQQGQMEIQNAYNELNQTCNACQTQQNLKQLQQGGCQGCQQAQQVIQNVQRQGTGCASCGTQPTQFSQLEMPQTGQRANIANLPLSAGQPMLMPLTGTSSQQLQTVQMQPGVMAGQLPIAVEMGPPSNIAPQFSMYQPTSSGGMPTSQPMNVGMTTTTDQSQQNISAQPMPQFGLTMTPPPSGMPSNVQNFQTIPQAQNAVYQPMPQFGLTSAPPPGQGITYGAAQNVAPIQQQPAYQPTVAYQTPPVATPTPPSQIPYAPQLPTSGISSVPQTPSGLPAGTVITGVGGATQGYGAGGGKAGPGAAGGISVNNEGQLVYAFNVAAGPGIGNTGIGGLAGGFGPGAFDTHRPDLHKGGGWHNTLPMGALENVFNLY